MSEKTKLDPQDKRMSRIRNAAVASSFGYSLMGAQTWEYPGLAPKVAAVGLALKGADDYTKAMDLQPFQETRQRGRQRFSEFMETWSQNDGTSLRDKVKRNIGSEMGNFKDREFNLRFNRMMGGMMMGLAGIDMVANGSSNTERAVGMTLGAVGTFEHLNNIHATHERSDELARQQPAL